MVGQPLLAVRVSLAETAGDSQEWLSYKGLDGGRSDEKSTEQIETRHRFSFGCDAGIRNRSIGVPAVSRVRARSLAGGKSVRQPGAGKLPPLEIAREGYLFAGGKYSTDKDAKVMSGQIYAEFQIPAHQRHPYPIVFIHGGAQTGTNFTGTPDGREGWAQFFLRQGYAVYVVDQAGRGRSAYLNSALRPANNAESRFRAATLHSH